jgi:hypothetical protein
MIVEGQMKYFENSSGRIAGVEQGKAAKAKPEEFVEFRFLDELKKSGYWDKLYGCS